MYLVTHASPELVKVQKVIHPFSSEKSQLRSKVYQTHLKHVRIIHSVPEVPESGICEPASSPKQVAESVSVEWNPISSKVWEVESDDEDDDKEPKTVMTVARDQIPDIPGDLPLMDSDL